MRVVIQRVVEASVTIDSKIKDRIGQGLLILLGIEEPDGMEDAEWLCRKVVQMRIFGDEQGLMNRSVLDVGGEIMVISQFTLHASTKKGNRPSFIAAAKPDHAVPLYEFFVKKLAEFSGRTIATGVFGADMKVALINDGPVTILMDSRVKE